MIKVQSFSDVLERYFVLSGKALIDVGCGTGDLVRWATKQGARAIGIDTAPGGAAVFLEPLPQDGSYYDIVRLIEDETEVRALAFRVIASAFYLGFKPA